jgi:sec-independent protein translocase protein TatC
MSGAALNTSFVNHLIELRDRLLRIVVLILVLLIGLFPFANTIYTFIADPLMAVLPVNTSMIATQVASPFLTPFKLSLITALFIAMPYLLHQLWAFITPGLYRKEKRLAQPILISSILLFYLGTLFAYFIVFPLIFAFLTSAAPEGVAVMTDISHYLDFVLTLFFAFGLSFEVPVVIVLLVLMEVTTADALAKKRPYMIVGAFVVGMLLTPPDVISQTLLAIPVWLLFEAGIIVARLLSKKKTEDTAIATTSKTKETQPSTSNFTDSTNIHTNLTDNDPQARKLAIIHNLRKQERYREARVLLYEVLAEGNAEQRYVAKNILAQLDAVA